MSDNTLMIDGLSKLTLTLREKQVMKPLLKFLKTLLEPRDNLKKNRSKAYKRGGLIDRRGGVAAAGAGGAAEWRGDGSDNDNVLQLTIGTRYHSWPAALSQSPLLYT